MIVRLTKTNRIWGRLRSSNHQGKPGEPGHRSIGRGSCRSALTDGVERRSTADQWYGGYPCTPGGGPMGHSARSTVPPPPSASSVGVGRHRGGTWVRQFSPPGVPPRATRFPGAVGRPGSKRRPLGHCLPSDPALVPVWSRADRAVRTVPPAVCSQVKRAVVCACHVHLCTSMFVWALLFRPGWRHLAPGGSK